jgi:hypothetical protein
MEDMKQWYKSKAVWAALGLGILGLVHWYRTDDLDRGLELILTALAMFGIRTGFKKIS